MVSNFKYDNIARQTWQQQVGVLYIEVQYCVNCSVLLAILYKIIMQQCKQVK